MKEKINIKGKFYQKKFYLLVIGFNKANKILPNIEIEGSEVIQILEYIRKKFYSFFSNIIISIQLIKKKV